MSFACIRRFTSIALSVLAIGIDSRDARAGSAYDSSGRLTTATYDTGVTITDTDDSDGNRSQDVVTMPTRLSSPSPTTPPPTPPPVARVTISRSTNNLNLWNYLVSKNSATSGQSGAWKVLVAPWVTIGSSSTAAPAFDTGVFPAGSTLTLVNNGTIMGAGGAAGTGGTYAGTCQQSGLCPGTGGQSGGPALRLQIATTIDNTNGQIWGGGGGGGGGGGSGDVFTDVGGNGSRFIASDGGGGGGGAGSVGGSGGPSGPNNGSNGAIGAQAGGGAAGAGGCSFHTCGGAGGDGGGPGAPGASGDYGTSTAFTVGPGGGGPAGYSVVGSALAKWTAVGDRRGPLN